MFARQKSPRKTSIGIALCRRSPPCKTNEVGVPQVLLIKYRTSYNYNSLVFGKYRPWDNDKLLDRLNKTTLHEKILLMSCDFAKLWHHIWLRVPTADETQTTARDDTFYEFYINCRNKFEKLITRDGGKRLKQLIARADSIELGWAIPRGRQNADESEHECAVREVEEETCISEKSYTILPDVHPICSSYEDDNTIYVCKYYVAAMNPDYVDNVKINLSVHTQISEISDIGWFGMREIRTLIGQNHNLYEQTKLALRLFKTKYDKVYRSKFDLNLQDTQNNVVQCL